MDKLIELERKEAELERMKKEVESLKDSDAIKKEMAFRKELDTLLKKHEKSLDDIVVLARGSAPAPKTAGGRRKRKLKIYINPHTGERVETRGGNHKVLKAWKEKHGKDTVEGWVQN